jgi:uncharacterized membrane protein YbhN (UPF0104 family)
MTGKNRFNALQLLKIAVFLLSCWYIWYHINSRISLLDDTEKLLAQFNDHDALLRISIAVILMFANWIIEAVKWKYLVNLLCEFSLVRSLRSVLTGITVSFYTPNRIGEFAGKVMHLEPEYRAKGCLLSFIGSSAQLLVTLQLGLIAVLLNMGTWFDSWMINKDVFLVLLSALVLLMTFGWFRISWLNPLLSRLKLSTKIQTQVAVFAEFHTRQLLTVYGFSFLRYLIFSFQQYLLLQAFGVNIDLISSLQLTAISFLLITIIPSIALGELGIRGGVNIAVFGMLVNNTFGILAATFMLWLINLAIPALFGAVSMLYIKVKRDA